MAKYGPEKFRLRDGREVEIRNLTAKDANLYPDWYRAVSSQTNYTLKDGTNIQPVESCAKVYEEAAADSFSLRLGAFHEGALIGQLGFHAVRENHPWLRHVARFGMAIDQNFWNQGLGTELLRIMEAHAQANGFTRVEAEVRTKNKAGLALYQKCGYRIEGTRHKAALINDIYEDEHFIAKLLDEPSAWKPPVMETKRLVLRPVCMDDAQDLFAYAGNPNVARFVTWDTHQTIEDSKLYLRRAIAGYHKYAVTPLAITVRGEDKMLGTVGTWQCGDVSQRCMELGYALAESHWGKGIVAEASVAVCDYIFKNYFIERIQARCITENKASAKVMEKIGMKYEGTLHHSFYGKNKFWDLKMFAVLRGEWRV